MLGGRTMTLFVFFALYASLIGAVWLAVQERKKS